MDSLCRESIVRGDHAYKDIQTPFNLCVEQETHNAGDRFTVAIVKAKTIVGHIPCKFSLCFDHFPIPLSNFQLLFSDVTLTCVWECAPISHI